MPPKQPQPAGRPDPVTLEAIFDKLTSSTSKTTDKAYHLVALGSVAFHAVVKQRIAERPDVIKAIASFLVLRDACVAECRWETLSLIGELCRRERKDDDAAASHVNASAKRNAEMFALIPWFRGALKDVSLEVDDKDCPIACHDILSALPTVLAPGTESSSPAIAAGGVLVEWSKEQREKAHDLMFLDATTTFNHLIPLVSRSSHLSCANCSGRGTTGENGQVAQAASALLRCASCKAVHYCSKECQLAHWHAAHKLPCLSMKKLVADAASASKTYVPLEPSLFYETRRFIYDHRNESLASVPYETFFMEYATGRVTL